MKTFSWTSGYRPTINAQILGEFLATREKITPDELLEEATPAKSEIHPAFEWNNSIAGHEYRRAQARKMLGALRVTITVRGRPPTPPVRCWVHVTTRKLGSVYASPKIILSDSEAHNSAILECLRLLAGIRSRFSYLKELRLVWEAVDSAVKAIR